MKPCSLESWKRKLEVGKVAGNRLCFDCFVIGRDFFYAVFISHSERKVNPLEKLISEDTVPPLCLPATAQVVRLVPDSTVPKNDEQITQEDEDPRQFRVQRPLGYLEVTDVLRR